MDQSFVFLINPNKFQAAFALGLPFVRGFVLRYPPSARGSLRGRLRIGGTSNLDPNRQVMWESPVASPSTTVEFGSHFLADSPHSDLHNSGIDLTAARV